MAGTPHNESQVAVAMQTPKRRDREVFDAAARVFYRRGYAQASVQDVADELGILKGSLYHYIKTKEDLLYQLLAETHEDVSAILDEVAALDSLDPLDRLHLYVRQQVEYNLDHVQRVAVYYRDLERLSEGRRRDILARRREHEDFVVDLIVAAQEQALADADLDPRVTSSCVFATVIWSYTWYRPDHDVPEHVAATCADFAIRGLVGDVEAARND